MLHSLHYAYQQANASIGVRDSVSDVSPLNSTTEGECDSDNDNKTNLISASSNSKGRSIKIDDQAKVYEFVDTLAGRRISTLSLSQLVN